MIWIIIDGTHWARCAGSMNTDGVAYFFDRRIDYLRRTLNPEHVVCCWEGDGPTFRHRLFSEYKADRSEKTGEHHQMIQDGKDACVASGVPNLKADGFEADDCIATLAQWATEMGRKAVIATRDKDQHQMLRSGHISQLLTISFHQGDATLSYMLAGPAETKRRPGLKVNDIVTLHGIRPNQWVEYLAMVGGKDNVPSIEKIGEVTAKKFFANCNSYADFLADPTPVRTGLTHQQCDNLLRGKERFRLAKRLHTLDRGVNLTGEWIDSVAAGDSLELAID